jgi:hypothetical protein
VSYVPQVLPETKFDEKGNIIIDPAAVLQALGAKEGEEVLLKEAFRSKPQQHPRGGSANMAATTSGNHHQRPICRIASRWCQRLR